MIYGFIAAFLMTLFLIGCKTTQAEKNLNPKYFKKRNTLAKFDRFDLALQREIELTKDLTTNTVPKERLVDARRAMEMSYDPTRAAISGIVWSERGPNNIGGRTRALAFDHNDATYKTVWAGSVGGGLWKTTDITVASPTWVKINDAFDNLAITTFAQSTTTPNTMYFGTGEGFGNIDAIRGLGIWKSTDGGGTWSQLTSTNNSSFYYVQKLIIDSNGNLLAATSTGLWRSTNGGANWAKVLGTATTPSSGSNFFTDIELAADGSIYAGCSAQVWKSSFATHGANTGALGNWSNISPVATYARTELACAPSNSDRLYVLTNTSSNCTNMFTSNDGGGTWTAMAVPTIIDQGSNSNFTRGQAWYDLICAVDPNNDQTVYVAGVDACRSTNAGTSWEQITTWSLYAATGFNSAQNVHADHHAITFRPGSSTTALFGTDGGVYYTINANNSPSKPTFAAKNSGYNVTQFYACAVHPTAGSNYFLAGAQDNGTQKFNSAGIASTTSASGGDGGFCHIDQDNPNYQITSYTNNNFYFSTNGGASFSSQSYSGGSFINPTDYDNTANILYAGNASSQYRTVSGIGGALSSATVSVANIGGTISHVRVSPNVANRVYFGTTNGRVVRVDDAHLATPTSSTVLRTGSGAISCVEVQVGNEDHILFTISNYGQNSVFETTNGTNATPTWTSVEGNLPDMPVWWALFNPYNSDQALIATELGVWSTGDLNGSSTNWGATNGGLANVRVDMLQYRSSDDLVAAATHGRGLFTTTSLATSKASFTGTSTASNENNVTTGIASSCKRYTVAQIPVTLTKLPSSGTVEISFSVNGASTAVLGEDFVIPVSTMSFSASDPITKYFEVYVVNDGMIESGETVVIDLDVISGGFDGSILTHTLTINDNDINPLSGLITQTIWSEDFEGGTASWAFNNPTGNSKNKWRISSSSCSNRLDNNTLAIYQTDASGVDNCGYGDWGTSATSKLVAYRPVNAAGYSNLQISYDIICVAEYDGTYWDYANLVYSTDGGTNWVVVGSNIVNISSRQRLTASLPAALDNSSFLLGWRWVSDGSVIGDPPIGVDNLVVSGDSPVLAESTVASAQSVFLKNGQSHHFYSLDGEILATITQLSGADIGCVEVSVEAAGTGTSNPSWLADPYLITGKAIHVQADNNANYEITLYYTNAEMAAWGSPSNLNMLKSSSAITSITGSSGLLIKENGVDLTATSNASMYAYTTQFTGFSSFVVTDAPSSAVLPIELISFTGKSEEDGNLLEWRTASELNNKEFELERSPDGVTFSTIAKLSGKGTTLEEQQYQHLDKKPLVGVGYYRLKQVDFDGKFSYSDIVSLAYHLNGIEFKISPNPATENISVPNVEGDVVSVFNSDGKLVHQEIFSSSNATLHCKNWPVGIYFVRLENADGNVKTSSFYKK